MAKVKVSVVIPVYNTEKYVAATLHSIMEQDLKDIEVIVVDDGSTDNSYTILKTISIQDNRIRLLQQRNQGQGAARNLGMKYATGEYIYFMDSDDLLSRNTLSQCYQKCQTHNLDFVFFDAEVFGLTDLSIKFNYRRSHLVKDDIYSGLSILEKLIDIKGYQVPVWLNFINLSFLKTTGINFHEGIHHEDQLFTFLLYVYANRVGRIDEAFFKRRVRPNSTMTSKFSRSKAESYFFIARKLVKLKKTMKNPKLNRIVDQVLSSMMNNILYSSRELTTNERSYILSNILKYFTKYSYPKNILLATFPVLRILKAKHQ